MRKLTFLLLSAVLAVFSANILQAGEYVRIGKKDTLSSKSEKNGIKSIDEFFEDDVEPMMGMTPVYKQKGKFYISLNDSLFGREIIMVTRISKAAEGIRSRFDGYAGDEINSGVFTFEKGPDDNIFMRKTYFRERAADPESGIYQAVKRSNLPAIVETFDIKAMSEKSGDYIIDVTDLFNSDSEVFFFQNRAKKSFKLGALKKKSSYISDITTYPINTEVKSVKTFARTTGGQTATYELNNSFVLLPKTPMTPRLADDRVGYFTTGYTDFAVNPQGIKKIKMITRWRLEPKPEDMERYKRGELVEPVKPIVFYIDPATPEEWVPYLIQGVNDWQPVFEKAGFKNAIYARRAPTPEEDPEWSLEDARFSAIVYKPSDIPNASGPHVHDPRSGEILESHINWYHNVMSLVRNWYFIQCAPADPAARKMVFDTELMGQLIRFVSSHEVGHTLGLRHNFGGTAFYTVDQLRDADFLRENGHTTSIMDYSRFNFVVQPEDSIPRELLFPRISHYDNWAIEWGYRRFPDIDDPFEELSMINEWIIEKTKDRRYWFGTESSANDPRLQAEDLSDNHMEANELAIKNLKFVMDSLDVWTKMPNEDYSNLRIMHAEVNNQFRRYIGHVAKWIGGIYQEPKTVEMPGNVYEFVEKEKQEEAMAFLERHLFVNTPEWLVPERYLNKYPSMAESIMEKAYSRAFSSILSRRVFMNLASAEISLGQKAYTVEDLFDDLNRSVWFNLGSRREVSPYKRVMQKSYVMQLCGVYTGAASKMGAKPKANPSDFTEASAIAYNQMLYLLKNLKKTQSKDFATNAHIQYLVRYIEQTLDGNL